MVRSKISTRMYTGILTCIDGEGQVIEVYLAALSQLEELINEYHWKCLPLED
ncbi:MAG: hypothetical protein ACPLPR_09590 [Bacillota bacterium]